MKITTTYKICSLCCRLFETKHISLNKRIVNMFNTWDCYNYFWKVGKSNEKQINKT